MSRSKVGQRILILATMLIASLAFAGPTTRKTKITFSQPVRVPGTTLPAGTYYFSAPMINTYTPLVRITDQNGNFIIQILGVPDYTHKSDHPIIIFGDHDCSPAAVKAWLYPGSGTGVRFIYSEEEAAKIASACGDPVPETHSSSPGSSAMEGADVHIMTPQKQEESYNPGKLSSSDEMDQRGFDSAPER